MFNNFKPFDKVLVRNKSGDEMYWLPNFLQCVSPAGTYAYTIDGQCWEEYLHYEGNEHLAFTDNEE